MREQLKNLYYELIRMRPVSSDLSAVNRAGERLATFLSGYGLFCCMEKIGGRNTLYAATAPGKRKKVLFNGHIDVVPALLETQYEPQERNGRLYARGALDCLGNLMAVLEALLDCREASASVIFSGEEEILGSSPREMLRRGYGAEKAVVVVDHHEDYGITCRHKGSLILRLAAHGKSGHAAYLMNPGENALDLLARAYLTLREKWQNPSSPSEWADSLNGTVCSAGMAPNQIPEEASLLLNIRFTESGGAARAMERVQRIVGDTVQVKMEDVCETFESDPEHPVIQKLKRCFEEVFPGHEIGFHACCGTTDARHFAHLGVPVAVTGIAGGGAHSGEEYAELHSIDQYAEIYRRFILACTEDFPGMAEFAGGVHPRGFPAETHEKNHTAVSE